MISLYIGEASRSANAMDAGRTIGAGNVVPNQMIHAKFQKDHQLKTSSNYQPQNGNGNPPINEGPEETTGSKGHLPEGKGIVSKIQCEIHG